MDELNDDGAAKKVVLGGLSLASKKKTLPKPSLASFGGAETTAPLDFVQAVAGGAIDAERAATARPPLVIPLTHNSYRSQGTVAAAGLNSSDQDAIAAILADSTTTRSEEAGATPPARIIPCSAAATNPSGIKRPILQASMIPGLAEIDNDSERFKADIAQRADNVATDSECYSTVPISVFGEGLLRGMGWDGKRSEEAGELQSARPARLGLGAKARPPSPPPSHKSIKRPGQTDKKAIENEAWAQEAAAKLASQRLEVGVVVWLREARFFVKNGTLTRARVTKVVGVPGLNAIEVKIEGTGESATVKRTDVILVEMSELEIKPFAEKRKHEAPRDCPGSKRSRDDSRSVSVNAWAVQGTRVRIVQEGLHQRAKGDVVRVTDGLASVRLDDGLFVELGHEALETIVPSVGGSVMVVRGKFRGHTSAILKKDRDREEVRLDIGGRREYFKFDDVTALSRDPV